MKARGGFLETSMSVRGEKRGWVLAIAEMIFGVICSGKKVALRRNSSSSYERVTSRF